MQTNNKFFDDMSKVMTSAMGVAQGAKEEAETTMKSWIDRWLADRDFVTREELTQSRQWLKRLAKRTFLFQNASMHLKRKSHQKQRNNH